MNKQGNGQRLKAGRYYRLTEDVPPIPKGTYLLDHIDYPAFSFRIGKQILFTLFGDCAPMLETVPHSKAVLRRTSSAQFVERYYALRDTALPANSAVLYTMCAVDQSVVPERLQRRDLGEGQIC